MILSKFRAEHFSLLQWRCAAGELVWFLKVVCLMEVMLLAMGDSDALGLGSDYADGEGMYWRISIHSRNRLRVVFIIVLHEATSQFGDAAVVTPGTSFCSLNPI